MIFTLFSLANKITFEHKQIKEEKGERRLIVELKIVVLVEKTVLVA